MRIEIHVYTRDNELTVLKRQPVDKLGRPTKSMAEVLEAAASDAQAWLRRNEGA